MAISLPQVPFKLTAQDMGGYDMAAALEKGINLGFLPREKKATLQSQLLKNIEQEIINKYKPRDFESLLASRAASTRGTNLENQFKQLENQYPGLRGSGLMKDIALYQMMKDRGMIPEKMQESPVQMESEPDSTMADTIASMQQSNEMPGMMQKNLANALMQQVGQQQLKQVPNTRDLSGSIHDYIQPIVAPQDDIYTRAINARLAKEEGRGSGGMSTAGKDQQLLFDNMKRANPDFTDDEIVQAINKVDIGSNRLDSGKHINFDYASRQAKAKVDTQGHPAAVTSALQQANQADAELNVFEDYASKFLEPYGDTYFNMSGSQILDTFKNDKQSQERLGDFIAGQAIQYEIAQIRNRIAGGKAGITSTRQLLEESKQHIDARFPRLSQVARERASKQINKVLSEGLEARNKVYKGQAGKSSKKVDIIDPDGDIHEIDEDKVDEAIRLYPGTRRA